MIYLIIIANVSVFSYLPQCKNVWFTAYSIVYIWRRLAYVIKSQK